ncbi:hypothetical protein [Nannocystis punicea]|uniref:Uncharacterized protein n=1 Tax=Nannocystis punicea TaxID=2995304 RepID=A0ABY7H5Q2_9BACT|nr:hypothetical protein [Nannocystis poenicansa]WAS94522.1 hypothetical protein O0S08_00030 [Nannocystis poenicansa]
MSSKTQEIYARFNPARFGSECCEYRGFAQEMLTVPEHERRAHLEIYYELLEDIVDGLFENYCGGTLSAAEKSEIFSLIRADWSDDAPGGLRASMLSLLGMIQPLEGVSGWLSSVANRQKDQSYADALRGCAACERKEPVV